MGGLRCVDGSYLNVAPVICRDSAGVPYEITLVLERNGRPYGAVGERCGWILAGLANAVHQARKDDAMWPNPDDRFPGADAELFAFRYRDRTDIAGGGELRCHVRSASSWVAAPSGEGRWLRSRRAFVEAWSAGGAGIRAVLTSSQLAAFLDGVVAEAERRLGANYHDMAAGVPIRLGAG